MQLHGRSDRVTRSVVALPSCPSAWTLSGQNKLLSGQSCLWPGNTFQKWANLSRNGPKRMHKAWLVKNGIWSMNNFTTSRNLNKTSARSSKVFDSSKMWSTTWSLQSSMDLTICWSNGRLLLRLQRIWSRLWAGIHWLWLLQQLDGCKVLSLKSGTSLSLLALCWLQGLNRRLLEDGPDAFAFVL